MSRWLTLIMLAAVFTALTLELVAAGPKPIGAIFPRPLQQKKKPPQPTGARGSIR